MEELDKGTALLTEWQAESFECNSEEEEEEEKEEEEEEVLEYEKKEEEREKEVKEMEDMEEKEEKQEEVEADQGRQPVGGKEGREADEELGEFIAEYVTMHRITSGYRWNTDEEHALQEALVSEGIGTLMSNVKVKIRKYTGDKSVA